MSITPEATENPFDAPQAPLSPGPAPERVVGLQWRIAWTVVFALNLIVPLNFALGMTHGLAWIGVAVGTALMLGLGHLAGARSRTVAFDLVAGGVCVGLSQVFPILQFIAGILSNPITSFLLGLDVSDDKGPNFTTVHEGFLMTTLTAVFLIGAALVSGHVIGWLRRIYAVKSPA